MTRQYLEWKKTFKLRVNIWTGTYQLLDRTGFGEYFGSWTGLDETY